MFLMEQQGLLDSRRGSGRHPASRGAQDLEPALAERLAQVADGARAEVELAGDGGWGEVALQESVNALPQRDR
jgi:hypothetical protein